MAVSMQEITHLRKMMGAGMMDCKKALEEAQGDFDKAVEIIRKKGQAVAAKRSDREAAEGCVLAKENGNFAAIVAVKCETDFVAKNTDFIALTQEVLNVALEKKPTSKEELLDLPLSDGRSVAEHITDRSGITGEKMELGAYEFVKGESTISYIHPGNKLATIVAFNENADHQVARDVAMQVAAMNPLGLCSESVPADVVAKEREIAREKALQSGKPEAVIDRIVDGTIQKFFAENTLLQQFSVKNSKETVQEMMHRSSKTLTAIAFKRFTLNVD